MTRCWTDTLPADSEAAALLRSTDWGATALGPLSSWSAGLRTAVGLVLRSRFPMLIAWGSDLVQVYNDAMTPLVGAKHPQFGCAIRDTWAEIWDDVRPMLQGVLDTGEPTWSEDQLLMINRNGFPEDIYITFSYSPLADEDGTVVAVLATTVMTTERVVDARRMRALNAVSTLASTASDPLALATDVAAELVHHAEDLRFVTVHLDEGHGLRLAASTHAPDELDLPLDSADGDAAWSLPAGLPAEGRSVPLGTPLLPPTSLPEPLQAPVEHVVLLPLDAGDAGRGVLSVGRSPHRPWDDTYRAFLVSLARNLGTGLAAAAARQSERRRLEELAALDRAKSDFLGDVSHEFRTPLTLISGPLAEVLAGHRLQAADEHRVELALRATDRLTRLVDSLLAYTRAESGALTAERVPVELGTQVRGVAELFRPAAESAGLRWVVDVADLPGPVLVDPQQLETVLVNLLANAVKFTAEGEVRVVVRAAQDGGVVEVQDTGIGIPEDELALVFERFHRSRNERSRSVEGTGIGLSLVQRLVQLQEGSIEVSSRGGSGTTFRVTLPWAARSEVPVTALPSRQAESLAAEVHGWTGAPAAVGGLGGLADALLPRVVLAEDNADVRSFVTGVLAGHVRVEAVPDGAAALRALRRQPADLLLTDVRMPVLDGRQLLAAVRSDPVLAPMPVVLFSAHADRQAAVDALGAGADDYLVKPFTPAQLVARVRSSIELARTRRQSALVQASHRSSR